jgi:pimeloyl-ACP methyl ester carboxylesterase
MPASEHKWTAGRKPLVCRIVRVILLFTLCCFVLSGGFAATPPRPAQTQKTAANVLQISVETGEIEGAKYTLARPTRWNKRVLLIAHGFRPESAPLVADLFPDHQAYRALLEEGWIVAKTSYRRNGIVIQDAIKDLDNLRAEVVRRFGKAERVVVEGDSMGGLIAVLLAERRTDEILYQGVVAIGAALGLRPQPPDEAGLNMQPQIPVVFMANRSEFDAPLKYAEFKSLGETRTTPPVLLRIDRDGHVNVNQAERLVALRMLNQWLDSGRESLGRPETGRAYYDATRPPEPQPSRVFMDPDGNGFTAHVAEVSSVYGNVLLDAQSEDFAAINLPRNAFFQVTIKEKNFRVLFGKDFGSVKRGEWVTFGNADGFFWLARNGLNAAEAAQVQLGDLVHVRRYGTSADPRPTDAPSGQ